MINSRKARLPAALGLLWSVFLGFGSCATGPHGATGAAGPAATSAAPSAALSTSTVPVSATSPAKATPADNPVFSDMPRPAPQPPMILVLGLPSPEPGLWLAKPQLGEAVRRPPSSPVPSGKAAALGEPALPARLAPAAKTEIPPKPPVQAGTHEPALGRAPPPAAKPPLAAEAAKAKKPAPVPAPPAAGFPSAAERAQKRPAVVETLPSPPSSLVPLVDLSAPIAPPPSRSFQVEEGGMAYIPFVGAGWTYLGERDGKDGVQYDSRRFEGAGALFSLIGTKVGEYNLRFLRQDLVNGTSSEELVHLSVLPKGSLVPSAATQAASQSGALPSMQTPPSTQTTLSPMQASPTAQTQPSAQTGASGAVGGASGAVGASGAPAQSQPAGQGTAPLAFGTAGPTGVGSIPAAGATTGGSLGTPAGSLGATGASGISGQGLAPSTASPASSASSPSSSAVAPLMPAGSTASPALPPPVPGSPEAFLATARAEYAAGHAATTVAAAESYLALSPQGAAADEALLLEAQALELNSPSRDIAKALSLYRRLIEGWPRSNFWSQANDRAAYIQRYYFDIR